MKLTIDNLDGLGPIDYTGTIETGKGPHTHHKLHEPSKFSTSLILGVSGLLVPQSGGRVVLSRSDGALVFTGRVSTVPSSEYAGWGERGLLLRYSVVAVSDELLLDNKTLPTRSAFVNRTAGDVLREITKELAPGVFDVTQVAQLDVVPEYQSDPQKKWSAHAAELGVLARGRHFVKKGQIIFQAIGANTFVLDESLPGFAADGLKLTAHGGIANDVTVIGLVEPQAYVTDYFVGDGVSLHFSLSQAPFTRLNAVVLDEEWIGAALNPVRWSVSDPQSAVSVSLGKLQINGGTGVDGQSLVDSVESIDAGGALFLQHGDTSFSASSNGVIGGVYAGAINVAGCVAGFRVTPSGGQSSIQALVNGALVGAALVTQAGHRYVFATRLYASEAYRRLQTFHSSSHPAGAGRGGSVLAAKVRVILEVHDIDPANPGSLEAPSIVLFDGVVANFPDACTYCLVNATSMHCSIAFTRILRISDALVRSALPGSGYRTRLTGSPLEGSECAVTGQSLQFFAAFAPVPNEQIVVKYRTPGRAIARVVDPVSIASLQRSDDDGTRGAVVTLHLPAPRTSADCVNAAEALLDDKTQAGWAGEYDTWSDFLPAGAREILPGDGLQLNVPSRGAQFLTIVREVLLDFTDLSNDRAQYKIRFATEAAQPLALQFQGNSQRTLPATATLVKDTALNLPASLLAAEITNITSTTTTMDAGQGLPVGYGVEVRRSDLGWGPDNDRNLIGRFTAQTFTVPRLAKSQSYFLRLYDGSNPPQYSPYSALLRISYPF